MKCNYCKINEAIAPSAYCAECANGGDSETAHPGREVFDSMRWVVDVEAGLRRIVTRANKCRCGWMGGCGCGTDCANIAEEIMERIDAERQRSTTGPSSPTESA